MNKTNEQTAIELLNEIINGKNIFEMCDNLNELHDLALQDDSARRIYDENDFSQLPTFGEEPYDTSDVFSWDESYLLVLDDDGRWETVDRED